METAEAPNGATTTAGSIQMVEQATETSTSRTLDRHVARSYHLRATSILYINLSIQVLIPAENADKL